MKNAIGTVLLGLILCASAHAQDNSTSMSLGKIPPYFNLPSDDATIRFTSFEKPSFTAPEYPEKQLENGTEGVVEVNLYVTSEGKVVYSKISVSSGNDLFDEAALKSAMKTAFPPGFAMMNGEPTDFAISIPFYFLLSADPEQYWHSRLELARIQMEYDELMTTFQGYLVQKTSVTKEQMQRTRDDLELKVAMAKKLHKVLAEKKESAILRLRAEITETKQQIEKNEEIMRDPNRRFASADARHCEVKVTLPQSGIVTLTSTKSNMPILDQLASEIELKKSYL